MFRRRPPKWAEPSTASYYLHDLGHLVLEAAPTRLFRATPQGGPGTGQIARKPTEPAAGHYRDRPPGPRTLRANPQRLHRSLYQGTMHPWLTRTSPRVHRAVRHRIQQRRRRRDDCSGDGGSIACRPGRVYAPDLTWSEAPTPLFPAGRHGGREQLAEAAALVSSLLSWRHYEVVSVVSEDDRIAAAYCVGGQVQQW